jgi:ParB family chromosome partitioning protein
MPRETTARPAARNPLAGFFTPQTVGVEDLPDAKLIDVALIDPNPHQPRRTFDQAALDDLAASIRRHGVLQPLLVRPDQARYQLIAGERRWRAAQRAAVTAVPCIVREIDDAEAEVLALLENVQRQDLDPVDEARAYQRLMDHLHLSQHALAVSLDLNHTYVRNRLLLIEDPRIEAAVRSGALGVTVAQEIARGTEEEQRAALLGRVAQGERLRVRDVKSPVDDLGVPIGENKFQQMAADTAPIEIENNFQPVGTQPSAGPRHNAETSDQDQHNHVALEDDRDTRRAQRDRTAVSTDRQVTPSTTWVRAEDVRSFVLLQGGHGRADREQLRQALWADLKAIDG